MSKKYSVLNLILYSVLFISTIIVAFIALKEVDHPIAVKFMIFYIISLLLYALYFIISIISNMRKLKWLELRKRFSKFIVLFLVFSSAYLLVTYFFPPSHTNSYGFLFTSLGCALGISFFDLALFKGKQAECDKSKSQVS